MAFKMNGSPAKMGTISGTAGHSSALKMKVEQDAASALKLKQASALKDSGHGGSKDHTHTSFMDKAKALGESTLRAITPFTEDKTYKELKKEKRNEKVKKEKEAETKTKTKPKKGTTSYSEAYKDADKSKYKTKAEFIKAAKDYNKKKYGTEEPTKESKKLIGKYEGDMTTSPKVTKKTAKKELAARNETKKVEAAKLEESKKQNEADVESGKAKKIVSPVTGDEAIDKREPLPETKKRTKAGKLGVQIGNIFRKKNKKKNPHRKVIKT
jgi:isoleucyl-tRNA synthetase